MVRLIKGKRIMQLKIAELSDIDGVLNHQYRHQVVSLNEENRKERFVTTPFTKEQLESLIIKESGLFIARHNGNVVAYVMAASWQFWSDWPMFAYMINELPKLKHLGIQLNVENSYLYGPILIDKRYRGSGLLESIFDFAREKMSKRYPILVTFVNKNNSRSYNAHTRKLGLKVIHEFEFNYKSYYQMAYDTSIKV